jgi:hypothetical protein
MARLIGQIQQQIITNLVNNLAAVGVTIDPTQWSDRNIEQLWTYVVATSQATFEQIMDAFTASIENFVAVASPNTKAWLQAKCFEFQYSAVIPQVLNIVAPDFAPTYPIPDPTLLLITECSVTNGANGSVIVKVAKGTPPEALDATAGGELDCFQGYLNQIVPSGINYIAYSKDADEMYCQATIYYTGVYASQIAVANGTVVQAITNFLIGQSETNFNNKLRLSDIMAAIRAVTGVVDVEFQNVWFRKTTGAIGDTKVVHDYTQLAVYYQSDAGYTIPETTGGSTLNDTLTYVAV